jgi:chemotaxis protein CheC
MAFENYELNEMQFDALKEIGNIGSGHAASALSSMLD